MAHDADIRNTLQGTQFGSSLDELEDGDLSRGYYTAGFDEPYEESMPAGPVRIPGQIGSESYQQDHGMHDEYGFVRRPVYRRDVERT